MIAGLTKTNKVVKAENIDLFKLLHPNIEPVEFDDEEYFASGRMFHVVDGKIVLGVDPELLKQREEQMREYNLLAELEAIDKKYGSRSVRALVLAAAEKTNNVDNEDFQILSKSEKEAENLRKQLRKLRVDG